MTRVLTSLSRRRMLPSLDARGKESRKRPWESQDSGWTSRVGDPGGSAAAAVSGKRLGTLAPTTARCEEPGKREADERRLCTVDRPSDRDHLFTGEGESCEEPFERDGMTHRSRGKKWHVVGSVCATRGVSGPECSCGWNGVLGTSNRKSKPENGLGGWEICRLGSLMIFGLSRVGWLPEYRVVFRRFWPVSALAKG
ncbi:hypothetical protein CRG98_001058 [Punica granatum]|uniref:Uncharacterized protein n=1 Tax=Punica granatum TaxID=22663 RepID=A0A2I0LCZ5_PUNGR|nr:hypothetical protein CRG98_001058 [Punica granatum]